MATVTLLTITACRNIRGQLNCTGLSPGHVFIPGPSDRHFKIQYCQVSVDVLNVQNSPMRNCFIQDNFFFIEFNVWRACDSGLLSSRSFIKFENAPHHEWCIWELFNGSMHPLYQHHLFNCHLKLKLLHYIQLQLIWKILIHSYCNDWKMFFCF